jgi:hypothetical protein
LGGQKTKYRIVRKRWISKKATKGSVVKASKEAFVALATWSV